MKCQTLFSGHAKRYLVSAAALGFSFFCFEKTTKQKQQQQKKIKQNNNNKQTKDKKNNILPR